MSNGRPWTADDTARLARLAMAGMTQRVIAEYMGRDRAQICRKMAEHNIAPGVSRLHVAVIARLNMRRRMAVISAAA